MADLPLSSSFLVDIEEAVLAEILSKLGTDSTTYPTPEYLRPESTRVSTRVNSAQ
jgi:hypothetical protein